jgi:hypothetical protein
VIGLCEGGVQSCAVIIEEPTCLAMGCSWNGTYCESSGTFDCADLVHVDTCEYDTGGSCSWSPMSACGGTPAPCSHLLQAECQGGGCTWVPEACTGSCTACNSYSAQTACNEQTGCSWDPAGPCTGSCKSCGSYSQSFDCSDQTGCNWVSVDQCTGTCTACSAYLTSATCSEQNGCSWTGP